MPLIELKQGREGSSGNLRWANFELRNVGRGHALHIVAAYHTKGEANILIKGGDLTPGEEDEVKIEYENGGSPFSEVDSRLEVFFQDVFGHQFSARTSQLVLHYELDE